MTDKKFDSELECPYCQEQIDDFKSHINGGLENGETFSCNNCDLVISNEQCLSNHEQIVHRDAMKIFSCETCNIDFTSKKYLFVHKNFDEHLRGSNNQSGKSEIFEIKTEIKEEVLEDDLFADSTDTFETMQSVKERFECEQCQKTLSSKAKLLRHVSVIHNGIKNFECDSCGKKFGDKWDWKKHVKMCNRTDIQDEKEKPNGQDKVVSQLHIELEKVSVINHLEGNKTNQCEQCSKTFKLRSKLKNHIETVHQDIRKYSCDSCNKSYKSKAALQEHELRAHSKLRPYDCKYCIKTFKVHSQLKKHMFQVHLDTKTYACDICEKHFKSNANLINHKKFQHSHIRNYKCELCPKTFNTSSNLKGHVDSVHSEDRKHQCNLCSKTFKVVTNLYTHEKVKHSTDRNYKCDICPSAYKFSASLNKHKIIKHSNQLKKSENKCKECGKMFLNNQYLKLHITQAHK